MAGKRTSRGTVALAGALVAAVPVGTFGLVAVSTYIGFGTASLLGLVVGVAWVVGVVRLLGAALGCWMAAFGAVLWLLALGSVASARDSVILSTSGVTATARVTAVHDRPQGKQPSSSYEVADENGVPIPNGMVSAGLHSHAVGDRLTVRYDPRGVAEARLPENVDFLRDGAVALGLNAVLLAGTAGLGVSVVRNGRPRRVPYRRGLVIGGSPRDGR
ncbi:DUF3592 domain-containing protein [Kitasatospora sp. NPDC001309]|uniref:DUF3592 domain-containing protein n=1 Tax=Kitasatospora sp. NPDC001309 TaxID=3364013 RepID=UPI00367732F6